LAASELDFPHDPQFAVKAGRILDLYARVWEGSPLETDEFVLSADEKTSIQARRRHHCTYPAKPGMAMKVEHEYKRCGAWAYLAALDVYRAKLFGRCERRNKIASFDRLVADVMSQPPYALKRSEYSGLLTMDLPIVVAKLSKDYNHDTATWCSFTLRYIRAG